jgi:polar amino acid transport system permease protein
VELIGFFQRYEEYWSDWQPELLTAALVTLEITAGAFALGCGLGLLIAIGKLSRIGPLRAFSVAYIEVTRGVPALVILFLLYFGLVPLGIVMEAITAGMIGLGLSAAGYLAEIFRAGIEATHRGQREAGLAVGLTPAKIYRFIILPQAFRVVLPPLLNMLIILLKDSSLASLISAPELMLRAKDLASNYFLPMHLFVLVGAIYFVIAFPISLLTRRLEARFRRFHGGRRLA